MALNKVFSKRTSPAVGAPKSTKGLQVFGVSKREQGHAEGHSYLADRRTKNLDDRDRTMGSSFSMAMLRDEANRVKAERKVPGALGYKESVDVSHITHRTIIKGSKRK